jgi:CheY-like chemotaxis protein
MTALRHVLAAADCPETVGQLEELLLATSQVALAQVDNATEALSQATRRRFELIMTEHPLVDLDVGQFLTELRGPESTSREAHVVVLTGTVDRESIECLGVSRLSGVEVCTNKIQALRAVTRNLRLSDRLCTELRVAVVGSTEHYQSTQLARTRNISASGMLLDADPALPVGTIAPIALELSSDEAPIHASAEVVRHTNPEQEDVVGMGMKFVDLAAVDKRRLTDFVALGLEAQRSAENGVAG